MEVTLDLLVLFSLYPPHRSAPFTHNHHHSSLFGVLSPTIPPSSLPSIDAWEKKHHKGVRGCWETNQTIRYEIQKHIWNPKQREITRLIWSPWWSSSGGHRRRLCEREKWGRALSGDEALVWCFFFFVDRWLDRSKNRRLKQNKKNKILMQWEEWFFSGSW